MSGQNAILVTVLAAVTLTACGNGTPPVHHATKPPPAASARRPACATQVQAWAHDRGTVLLHQIADDETALAKTGGRAVTALRRGSAATSQIAKWQAAATALETDAQAAISSPPPACADGAGYSTGMQDYTTAAKDELSAINDISGGSYGGVAILLRSAGTATQQGNGAMSQMDTAIGALKG